MTQSWLICEKGYQTKCVDCPIRDETASPCEYAIEVAPVQHGRWIMSSDRPDTIICTCCDSAFDVWKADIKRHHYCPNCGANMNGRRMESGENETEELG